MGDRIVACCLWYDESEELIERLDIQPIFTGPDREARAASFLKAFGFQVHTSASYLVLIQDNEDCTSEDSIHLLVENPEASQ